ncbi:MAG: hypothetical protein J5I92_12370 [Thiogranum sp.]|nr:hypothetical protein [Thiogranum sp.]
MTTPAEAPKWLENYEPQPDPARGNGKGWLPGQSGNPSGRPRGSKNKRSMVAQELEKNGSAIVRKLIEAALAGDVQALNIALQRIMPPLKARSEKVQFALDADAPLTQQARQVMQAVAEGVIDPDTGKMLIDSIGAFAALKGVDELEERLNKLENRMSKGN